LLGLSVLFLFLFIGFLAGILSGIFGIGGGVLIVPLLILVGLSPAEAMGTSLTALLPPVGIFGVLVYRRERLVNFKAGLVIALGLFLTMSFGAYLANSVLDASSLKMAYGLFLGYVSYRFLGPFRRKSGGAVVVDVPAERNSTLGYFLVGSLAGVLSGMFGIGGGAVIIPCLTAFFHYSPKRAAGTSLMVLLPPVGCLGAWVYYTEGNLPLDKAWPVVLGLLIGTLFGANLSVKLPENLVKKMFGVFLLLIAIKYVFF
jgi:uncharacterized membrane protein YfcA